MSEKRGNSTKPESVEQVQPAEMNGFTILQIITWTNAEIERCREKLESEPSGRVLAYLQGKIPGCKFTLESIRDIFKLTEDFFTHYEKPCEMSTLTHEQILDAEIDMEKLQKSEPWQSFLNKVDERAAEMKNYLLFHAKKSRDLDVHQGEYNGIITYKKVFDSISENAKFWRESIFKKGDDDPESGGMQDANDPDMALLPPGLPPPEDEAQPPSEDYEEPGERDYDDLPDEGEVIGEAEEEMGMDPNIDMDLPPEDEEIA